MKKDLLKKVLLLGVVLNVGAVAKIQVDKSSDMLVITSTISGTVIAKIVGPNDKVVVNTTYEGNSFSWVPSGVDGAYKYDVRVIPKATQEIMQASSANMPQQNIKISSSIKSDYAGGSIEIVNGKIVIKKQKLLNSKK